MNDTMHIPEFSVIVPVYKVEQYLGRCIASVLAQTFADLELILIDDGSPDESGAICDRFAAEDDRIIVIHQKNRGVSAARNAGLDIARGEYIVFVDSDDAVEENYLECMRGYDADMVIAGVKNYSVDGSLHHTIVLPEQEKSTLTTDLVCQIINCNALNYPISKRYLKALIQEHGLRFRENMDLCEDTLFFAGYLCRCSSVQYSTAAPYHYFKYTTTTLTSFTPDYILKQTAADRLIGHVLDMKFPGITATRAWKKRCWNIIYYCIFYILRDWNAPVAEKKNALHIIFSMPEYREYSRSLDDYMQDDPKIWRLLLRSGSAGTVMLGWKLSTIISKLKGHATSYAQGKQP